jgi:hypothetical protein
MVVTGCPSMVGVNIDARKLSASRCQVAVWGAGTVPEARAVRPDAVEFRHNVHEPSASRENSYALKRWVVSTQVKPLANLPMSPAVEPGCVKRTSAPIV